ncbi:MAG: ORF6N domain-containing protein [Verrucomicrobiota bacterium]
MKRKVTYLSAEPVEQLIQLFRGQRVILDADLARVYGVTTKRLNEAVRRNRERFPVDFMFQLTQVEADAWQRSRSQIATLKRGFNIKYLPHVFTEHGAIMAATVLSSPQAVQMSVFVMRAFVKMREVLVQNKALAEKLAELERKLTSRLDTHEEAIVKILDELRELMNPPQPPRKQIGFHVKERRARYGVKT